MWFSSSCLYSALSLTCVREQRFIRMSHYCYYYKAVDSGHVYSHTLAGPGEYDGERDVGGGGAGGRGEEENNESIACSAASRLSAMVS